LEGEVIRLVRFKQNASFWLGLVQYETANYESAVYWLKDRTLEASDGGPWTSGARYNLARTYDRQGSFEQARQLLLLDDSPQKHGNLLRARYLRQRIEAATEGKSASPPKKP
jgi:hypothetical protein